jgi:hypothetical protein
VAGRLWIFIKNGDDTGVLNHSIGYRERDFSTHRAASKKANADAFIHLGEIVPFRQLQAVFQ